MRMKRFSWLALIALLTSFVVCGCYADSTDREESSSANTAVQLASNVYQEDGVAICPVRGGPIADISSAPVRENDGMTFYFC